MAVRTWNWNNFRGGLSDNPYLGVEGSFQNGSYGIDNFTEPTLAKLTSSIEEYLTTDSRPNIILTGTTGVYTLCNSGEIYQNTTKIATLATTPKRIFGGNFVYNSVGTEFIYFFTAQKVHKISTSLATLSENIATIEGGSSYKPSVSYGGNLYFASSNFLYSITPTDALTTIFTAPIGTRFTGLSVFQDQFRLYGYDQSNNGVQYIVPLSETETSFDYMQYFENSPIIGIVSNGAFDYIIMGETENFSDLYIFSGTQSNILKTNYDSNNNGRSFNGIGTARLGDLFLAGDFPLGTRNIYRYGSYFSGIQPGLTSYGTLGTNVEIYSMGASRDYLYIGTDDGSNYKVYKVDLLTPPTNNKYSDVGEIISNITDLGNPYGNKQLLQVDIAYDCDNSHNLFPKGGTITLYARKDTSDSWTQIVTRTPSSGIGSIRVTSNEIRALNFGDFYQIEFKLKLEPLQSGGVNTYTPGIKGILVTYEDGIKQP